jgi:hypothetical protein
LRAAALVLGSNIPSLPPRRAQATPKPEVCGANKLTDLPVTLPPGAPGSGDLVRLAAGAAQAPRTAIGLRGVYFIGRAHAGPFAGVHRSKRRVAHSNSLEAHRRSAALRGTSGTSNPRKAAQRAPLLRQIAFRHEGVPRTVTQWIWAGHSPEPAPPCRAQPSPVESLPPNQGEQRNALFRFVWLPKLKMTLPRSQPVREANIHGRHQDLGRTRLGSLASGSRTRSGHGPRH